ncbi:uncharacterized protein EV420DRAFT_1649274 [Desarmillaria tabescens]|uniref:Uncharacterized protein n=1 Tax=Armillaria tabescens TaxID=1929756 RepID=A0AA39JMW9_ARMTA|nr:uncharacterized protein EV420DRAFT_1649274 [Desarmillaria tabescens]KAK0443338.1 hypothetical protein EV420DRAFT_1649274 [Desarmillaria tabescens]
MAFVALRAWDGLHGALVNDNIFITSPNCTGLYSPPLGVNREMWMWEDFRYGVDDPLDDSDPDVPLFELLLWEDFEELDPSSLIRRPGFWCREHRCVFQQCCWAILGGCEGIPHVDEAAKAGANRADELLGYARMFLECLDGLPLTFHRLCLCIAEMQRLILEAEAIKFFFGTICPSFLAPVSEHVPKPDADLVGCIMMDISVAQQFHQAGVPVWLLRALDTLPHTRINAVGRLKTAEGRLHMGPCPLRLPSVYVGGAGPTSGHQICCCGVQESFTQKLLEYQSMGVCSRLPPGRFAYHTTTRAVLVRDICPAWKVGLSSVERKQGMYKCPSSTIAPFLGPDLFATIADGTKLDERTQMSHQMWRAILTYDWVGQSDMRDRIREKITDRRELALKFLEGCLGEMSVEAHGILVEGKWQGMPIRDVSREDVHEIHWELA